MWDSVCGGTGNKIRERMTNHRSTIKLSHKHTDKPVANHFSQPGHSINDPQVTVIECLGKHSKFRRKYRETYWIKKLDTYQPNGFNLRE